MNRKSKFVVFLLSIVPGLSHFYLGVTLRGTIFMAAAFVNVIATIALSALFYSNEHLFLLLGGLPVIWFIALIDSLMLAERINTAAQQGIYQSSEGLVNGAELKTQNKKILTCFFSIVPGAGHMYLGYQKQGLELMTIFFFSFFFIDWLRISLFMFIIPVIWFYSMFDALGKVSSDNFEREDKYQVSLFDFIAGYSANFNGSKLLGYSLVGIGLLLIFDRIVSPLIGYQLRHYLQTGIVSLLFIFGGIRILMGGSKQKSAEEVETECQSGE